MQVEETGVPYISLLVSVYRIDKQKVKLFRAENKRMLNDEQTPWQFSRTKRRLKCRVELVILRPESYLMVIILEKDALGKRSSLDNCTFE